MQSLWWRGDGEAPEKNEQMVRINDVRDDTRNDVFSLQFLASSLRVLFFLYIYLKYILPLQSGK